MDPRPLKRLATVLLVTAGVAMGVAALVLLARSAPSLADFGQRHVLILGVNAVAAGVLLLIIVWNAWRLGRDYWRRAPGARLRARMVTLFAGLAVVPLAVVYFFAVQFLNSGIDNWFDKDLEQELATALRLSREAMDVQSRSRLAQTESLAGVIGGMNAASLSRALAILRQDAGADELAVYDAGFQLVAGSSVREQLLPTLPEDGTEALSGGSSFVVLEPEGAGRYDVRAVVRIRPGRDGTERYLQAQFPVPAGQGQLAESVQETYTRYAELRYLRGPLKSSLSVTLFLVLLLSALAALGGAFLLTRRLVAPIEAVARGTKSVAEGDYDTRLPVASADEIGFLTESFNTMLERLARAREDSRLSQQQLERERANLAAILGRLSNGVIALTADGRIRMANAAAGSVLGVDLTGATGADLDRAVAASPMARQFAAACAGHLRTPAEEWRGQIELRDDGNRRILNCATTALSADAVTGTGAGAIIVFDDVTALLQAQREAAWGEVARRLAHEIKNPLTPIRLAAERIRRRYLPQMGPGDGDVLDRSTHTIVQQVEAMRDMVNAFSDYARAPALALAPLDLNQLVREVAWLYRAQDGQPALRLELDEAVETVEADALRVRQLLHNLLRNAQDALEAAPGGQVEIATRLATGPGERPMAEITVTDNGPGIDAETLPRVFDPYVTTKTKGTGLGLAIVKRLVEEHGGTVAAANLPGRGARITVRLPLRAAPRESQRDNQRDNQREATQGLASHSSTTPQQARPQPPVEDRVAGEVPAQPRRESA